MRRRVRTNSAVTAENGGEQGFWPSYADMMSAVALILFFLMLLAYVQNLITGNDLQNTQHMLDDTLLQVALIEDKLKLTEDELKLLEKDMQELTDKYVKEVDVEAGKKEKELMEL